MQKNKILSSILILMIAFTTIFSFSVSYADSVTYKGKSMSKDEVIERLMDDQTENSFEMTLSGYALSIGDMILDYVTFLFNDELSIDRIVFNKVISLDANFFEDNGLAPSTTKVLKDIINNWYALFRGVAIVVYLIVLIAIGIKIILGVADARATAKDLLVKWTIGIAILFLFPYVMKYAFTLNDSIVNEVYKSFSDNPYGEIVGSYIGNVSDVQYDEVFEERSPEYISKSDYVYSLGSTEATYAYFNQLEKYKSRADVMRIMRAMAGITAKFIYVILWYIMMGQMLILAFMYTKRYLMIAFLIVIFPITVIKYVIGAVKTGRGGGFSAWCVEFFINVFLQSIHAVIYGIIGGVVMVHVQNGIVGSDLKQINWVILIIAVNFIFEGEAILKKIIKANAESVTDGTNVFGNARKLVEGAWAAPGKVVGFFKGD